VVLKPNICASSSPAVSTSFWLIGPTPLRTICTAKSAVGSYARKWGRINHV
jgi:hypothetical protein